jgi:hypothetical protein
MEQVGAVSDLPQEEDLALVTAQARADMGQTRVEALGQATARVIKEPGLRTARALVLVMAKERADPGQTPAEALGQATARVIKEPGLRTARALVPETLASRLPRGILPDLVLKQRTPSGVLYFKGGARETPEKKMKGMVGYETEIQSSAKEMVCCWRASAAVEHRFCRLRAGC